MDTAWSSIASRLRGAARVHGANRKARSVQLPHRRHSPEGAPQRRERVGAADGCPGAAAAAAPSGRTRAATLGKCGHSLMQLSRDAAQDVVWTVLISLLSSQVARPFLPPLFQRSVLLHAPYPHILLPWAHSESVFFSSAFAFKKCDQNIPVSEPFFIRWIDICSSSEPLETSSLPLPILQSFKSISFPQGSLNTGRKA